MPAHPFQIQELLKLVDDRSKLFYIGMVGRPGVNLFLVRFEYEHFVPDTPKNNEFAIYLLQWQGVQWVIAAFPAEYGTLSSKIAGECGLRIADGVPMVLGGDADSDVVFPLNGPNVFSLENVPGHWVYSNNPTLVAAKSAEESAATARIFTDHMARYHRGEFGVTPTNPTRGDHADQSTQQED